MLSVKDLSAGYGAVPVLRNISFSQKEGEILGIVGHNGMGKTTLLRALMGTLPNSGGSITLDNELIQAKPAYQRSRLGIGYVPQGARCFQELTVRDNLKLAISTKTFEGHRSFDEIIMMFSRLKPILDRRCSALSGGERQLLAVAQAVIRSPRLLLLDELTEGVQPSIVEEIAKSLQEIHHAKMGMIIVDQERAFVASLATRIFLMEKGRLVQEMAAADIRQTEFL